MSACEHPQNTGLTSYRKGCRCGRCCGVKAAADDGRPPKRKPCRDCGGPKPYRVLRCDDCAEANLLRRTVDKVEVDANGCWVFMGHRNAFGYGRVSFNRKSVVAHRVTYEHFVGVVPYGLELDHLCDNPPCCNPDHLEEVTHQENIQRGWRRRRKAMRPSAGPYLGRAA